MNNYIKKYEKHLDSGGTAALFYTDRHDTFVEPIESKKHLYLISLELLNSCFKYMKKENIDQILKEKPQFFSKEDIEINLIDRSLKVAALNELDCYNQRLKDSFAYNEVYNEVENALTNKDGQKAFIILLYSSSHFGIHKISFVLSRKIKLAKNLIMKEKLT